MEFAGGLSFPVAFAAGLVSFFSPCVLPLVPSYISVISGVSFDDLRHQADRNHTLRRTILAKSLLFILGFAVVFVALGTSFTLLGQALSEHREIITKVGGVLIIFFGLYTAGAQIRDTVARIPRVRNECRPGGSVRAFSGGSVLWTGMDTLYWSHAGSHPDPGQHV